MFSGTFQVGHGGISTSGMCSSISVHLHEQRSCSTFKQTTSTEPRLSSTESRLSHDRKRRGTRRGDVCHHGRNAQRTPLFETHACRASAPRPAGLGTVFFEAAGVSHRQHHQVLGLELSQTSALALRFTEFGRTIEAAILGGQQHRHRMPTV